MFNKLLPFTLIASFALPFIAKADELPVAAEQPKPAAQSLLSAKHKNFRLLVATAAYIECNRPEICTEQIKTFLTAVKVALEKDVKSKSIMLVVSIKSLDAAAIARLEEQYLDAQTRELLVQHEEDGKHLLIVFGVAALLTAGLTIK